MELHFGMYPARCSLLPHRGHSFNIGTTSFTMLDITSFLDFILFRLVNLVFPQVNGHSPGLSECAFQRSTTSSLIMSCIHSPFSCSRRIC